jgi:sigma-B regulation protein RsbU (phosphoserine phosphatase)
VPEATNAQSEMFGTERMLEALNRDPSAAPKEILQNVKDAVESFVLDAEQFDDMTMLCVEYKGKKPDTGV